MNTASHCSKFESSPAARYAAEKLLEIAPLIIGQQQTDKPCLEGRPKFSRREIILGSKSLLEKRDGKPISVKELATELKVSERTLRNIFNEYFGVSPLRYLQLRQLHQVYHALRVTQAQKGGVEEILLEKGVWDFPRFVSRYRQVFGQLPSETLRAPSK
jgi:AraC family ethanolamine operon transcriptional activator